MDGERDRPSDNRWRGVQRRNRPRGRHNWAHSRHEVQAPRRAHDPPRVRHRRRPADERVGGIVGADEEARPRPRGRRARPRWAGPQDRGRDALHRDPPRRHGRADARPLEAPRVERGALPHGVQVPEERDALEQVRRPARRRAAREGDVPEGDRVLPPAPCGDGRGRGRGVARAVSSPTRPRSGRSTRTSRSPRTWAPRSS